MTRMKSNLQDGMNKGNITKSTVFRWILFIIGLAIVWQTQREVPLMMDDEWYSTILSAETPLSGFGDIVQAQIWHYNNWGGRTVAHTIAQMILLYLSEPAANVLNTAVIALLAWLIATVAGEKRFVYMTFIIGFLHGLNPDWKMSMYWQTGACNYLYTTVLILMFLKLYLKSAEQEADRERPWLMPYASVLGLLCGWTNENMGPAVWVLTVLVMLLLKRENRQIKPWMISGSMFCMVGSAFMLLAPGNSVRSAQVVETGYGTLWQIFLRMYGVCKGMWDYLFSIIIVTAAVMAINVIILGNSLKRRDVLLLVGAILSWGAMVLSPHYPERAAFGTMCLLMCVLISQAASVVRSKNTKACRVAMECAGVFIWLRGMYCLAEFIAISWGWIR